MTPKTPKAPDGLAKRGLRLWHDVLKVEPEPDPAQLVMLEECCRSADRLDELDRIIQGKGVLNLMRFRHMVGSGDGSPDSPITVEVKFDHVLGEARQQQNVLKQLLVSLRLPDQSTGAKPQRRGARGVYKPTPVDDVAAMRGRRVGRPA